MSCPCFILYDLESIIYIYFIIDGQTYINIDNHTVDTQIRLDIGEPSLPVITPDRHGRLRDSGNFKPRKPKFCHANETDLSANFEMLKIDASNKRRSSTFMEDRQRKRISFLFHIYDINVFRSQIESFSNAFSSSHS